MPQSQSSDKPFWKKTAFWAGLVASTLIAGPYGTVAFLGAYALYKNSYLLGFGNKQSQQQQGPAPAPQPGQSPRDDEEERRRRQQHMASPYPDPTPPVPGYPPRGQNHGRESDV